MYYSDKTDSIKNIFATSKIILEATHLTVQNKTYPIVDDVIILCEPDQYTNFVKNKLNRKSEMSADNQPHFAPDIQFTFGEEWKTHNAILPEHKEEFAQYFDIVDIKYLQNARVCDLGCGMGRWSYFLTNTCREIILIDFSDAIFVARKNMTNASNCLFFMCDLKNLPFKNDFADFILCLGVLHHLPTPCLDEVRNLKKFAPGILVFLYYALDNRPVYFRIILRLITFLRLQISKITSPFFRKLISLTGALFLYKPLVLLGRILRPFHLSSYVPLYDFYNNKSLKRIKQDVYDRFFTRIEQRVSRNDILSLKDNFKEVTISDKIPYWHFLCKR